MPQIYLAKVKTYKAPKTLTDGTQFLPFTNKVHIKIVKDAIRIIDTKIKNNKLCNSYFKTLPLKKTSYKFGKIKPFGLVTMVQRDLGTRLIIKRKIYH